MIAPERLDEVAQGLEGYLAAELGAVVVDKDTSLLHRTIAEAFDKADEAQRYAHELGSLLSLDVPRLGLPTGAEYMRDYATTIGSLIALPPAWRRPEGARSRILTLPHEGTHVDQYIRGVAAGWWPRKVTHSVLYLASVAGGDGAEYLGHVEADAYAVTEAMRAWLGGKPRPVGDITDSLRRHYALAGVGVVVAEATLLSHYKTMETGGIPNVRVCRLAIDWLETHAADIKGRVQA